MKSSAEDAAPKNLLVVALHAGRLPLVCFQDANLFTNPQNLHERQKLKKVRFKPETEHSE